MRTSAFLAALMLCLVRPPSTFAVDAVVNGLMIQANGALPSGWHHEAYFPGADMVEFSWLRESQGPGVLRISNLKPNDSRWVQSLAVNPATWYHVSGWVRTVDVGNQGVGARISVWDNGDDSADVHGTADWRPVDFWLKTEQLQTMLTITCRIGGASALNT